MDKVKGDAIEGFTLLHKAVFHAKVDELQKLLEEKKDDTVTGKPFDVNAKCILKQTPLILCVRQHYDEAKQGKGDIMCKMLLDHGATVVEDGKLIRDAYGDATLHLAAMSCFKNGPGMLKMLVDKICEEVTNPADLTEIISESCENFKNTPLHWVALHGNIEAAKYLIEKGAARLGKKNKLKEKVIDYAKKYEHPKLLVLVESEEERRAAKRNASS